LLGKFGSDSLKDAALVAFYSDDFEDWRFSFVKVEWKFDNEKNKIRDETTPAKRYSFLVGKNEKSHTAQKQLLPLLESPEEITVKKLEEAFEIETVTKEFFEYYRELFIGIKLELDKIIKKDERIRNEFNSKNIDTVNFAKKLLGQIVFLYFLQKKGWFGISRDARWGDGPKNFLRRLFNKEYSDYQNFFNDILEPLFYEALRVDRSYNDHYYDKFHCRIPFLNGGLFDPINNYDWVHTDILLRNELFSNSNKTREGDVGNGILDIFDRYNFTINEEEPLEKEVALDPELLGKIYEKLNAIRSDNFDEYVKVLRSGKKGDESKFNKEYGVYYTPREIVHYMCQESLINYLCSQDILDIENPNNLDANAYRKEDIEKFVRYADLFLENEKKAHEKKEKIERGEQKDTKYEYKMPDSIIRNADFIDKLLADIKICDPAVGSGAFPIGMMHEIIKLRQLLSIYCNREASAYDLKRHCIENSLFGVDIDPGSVEICKLRFWLSMIVDEEDFYNIKPLPNLDYKVVCGDSLLGVEKDLFNQEAFNKLEKLKTIYFNETNPLNKQEYKKQINELIKEVTKGHTQFDFEVYFSEVFHQKGGFDIVIANPPYVKEYINRKAFDGKRNSPYYQGKMDIWYMFACKGIDLLHDKGIITFIAQNNWVTNYGASIMRNKVIEDTKIIQLVDFGSYFVFENSDIQTMIMIFQKNTSEDNYKFELRRLLTNRIDSKDIDDLLKRKGNSKIEYLQPIINRQKYLKNKLTFSKFEILLDKVESQANFKLIENELAQGIVIPQDFVIKEHIKILGSNFKVGDGIFVLSEDEKNAIPFTEKELELLKPYYTSQELKRYYAIKKNSYWIIYTDSRFKDPKNIKQYPNIKKHLDKFQEVITSDNKPYGLHRARDERFFKGEKIVSLRKCDYPSFTYTDFDCYVSAAFYVIKTDRINLKYLTGILNSKLIAFWFKQRGKMQGNIYQIDKEPLLLLPIKVGTEYQVNQIEYLVSQILSLTQSPDYETDQQKQEKVKELEKQIDQLVYKLYNLTEEEIKIIEGNKI
jgi:hypothetical protein